METMIREGTLRLLTTESSCDVILSCQGHRIMAHKVILSMVSPVFKDLLLDDFTDPAVIILPDISSQAMSLILDYIYTGTVMVYSNLIQQFLTLAKLFKIKLDIEPAVIENKESIKKIDTYVKQHILYAGGRSEIEYYSKGKKKIPELVPINKLKCLEKLRSRRRMSSCVLPSPWRPRVETIFGDPRYNMLENLEYLAQPHIHHYKPYENDPNNNFELSTSKYQFSKKKSSESNAVEKPAAVLNTLSKLNHLVKPIKNGLFARPPEEVDKNTNEKCTNWIAVESTKSKIREPFDYSHNYDVHNASQRCFIPEEEFKEDSGTRTAVKENNEPEPMHSDKEKPFKCDQCGKCFSQLRNFKYHRSVHEGTKEFAAKCSECGKIFNDRGYLSSHMKIHRDKKEYACSHCPKRFNQRVAYNMHIRIHTGVKPHECPTCGKSFSRKMLLKQHQRVHTGERPYSCPECGKTFADRSNMTLHTRLHTGVKPYACTLCPKSFTKKHHLKTHMNFHTGLKPYTCEKCGLAFSQSSNMRTHYKKCLLKSLNGDNERQPEEKEEGSNPL